MIHQISYDVCENNQVEILVSANGVLNIQIRTSTNWLSNAELTKEQPLMDQNIKRYNATLNPKDTSFKVYVNNLTTKSSTTSELITIKECSETNQFTQFEIPQSISIQEKLFNDSYDGNMFTIPYKMNGQITKMTINETQKIVQFDIKDSQSGKLYIKLPHELIWANDNQFTVLTNGTITNYKLINSTGDLSELEIDIPDGNFSLEIIGTSIIPEFGQISIIILASSIGFLILGQRKLKIN